MAQNNRGPITAFMGALDVDFARPNLFQVDISLPGNSGSAIGIGKEDNQDSNKTNIGKITASDVQKLASFTVKAAQLPGSTVGVIEVPFRGRMLKIAGDRTFEPWTITIQNDTTHTLRQVFLQWMDAIQVHEENATRILYGTSVTESKDYLNYMADMKVTQLDRRGNAIVSYKFKDCWPSNVAAIDLDYGTNDSIEEFTVELQTQYWVIDTAKTDNDLVTGNTAISPSYTPE
jgi:hypothetical protein